MVVVDVQANGNLVIAGTRVVVVDDETKTLRISGLVRQLDIASDNTLSSSQVADARIELKSEGGNARYVTKGPVAAFFDTLIWAVCAVLMMLRITFLCAIATGSLTAQGSRDLLDDPRPAVVVKRTVHDSNAEPRKPTNKPLVLPLRQITELQGAMPASLTGFGLVTGLDKTGSGSKVTRQAIVNFIRRHGLNPELEDVVPGSTALVAVSAQLPAFSKVGMPLDVHVTALGDEKELRGARLLPVQLRGWDGKVYAIADGPVSVNGFKATIGQTSVSKNHVTAGSISGGGRVVREIPSSFLSRDGFLELRLRNPSVSSSIAAADGINKLLAKTEFRALPVDGYMIRISMPNRLQSEDTAIRLLNRIGNVQVPVQVEAKVIINETSGLIIAGENVQISPCVLALSSLTITVGLGGRGRAAPAGHQQRRNSDRSPHQHQHPPSGQEGPRTEQRWRHGR